MAELTLKGIKKMYEGSEIYSVKDFNMKIEDKEFIVLVGPSGCGKSTTLRMIAGLEDITAGQLYIGDKLVNDMHPKERDIAMVFQDYALYPHMTVYENMAFGLKLRKIPKKEIEKTVKEAAKALEIEDQLDKKPKQLSGGQRQRVALGRAIVRKPKVFLMDEPLSNLDAKLRVQMRAEISKLHKTLETTFIYVTHDQTEAMTMGTRIIIMKDGDIMQVDTPQNVYENPDNLFVAQFIGSPQMNITKGRVIKKGKSMVIGLDENIEISLTEAMSNVLIKNNYENKEVYFGMRPEYIDLVPEENKDEKNVIERNIILAELMGSESYLHFNVGNKELVARVDSAFRVKADQKVRLVLPKEKVYLFDLYTEKRIKETENK